MTSIRNLSAFATNKISLRHLQLNDATDILIATLLI
jgi:hypothetical protein